MGIERQADPRIPRGRVLKRILQEAMRGAPPPIGPDLAFLLGLWARFMDGRNATGYTQDWHVRFLAWALRGRVRAFVAWAAEEPGFDAACALDGIRQVHDFHWPHNATCGYTFHAMWGWLQLELEKPGEREPATLEVQMREITKSLAAEGKRVKRWEWLGPGGVRGNPAEEGDDAGPAPEPDPREAARTAFLIIDNHRRENPWRIQRGAEETPLGEQDMALPPGGTFEATMAAFRAYPGFEGWTEEQILEFWWREPMLPARILCEMAIRDLVNGAGTAGRPGAG